MEIQPNRAAIRQHLDVLFAGLVAEYPDGLCEIAWTDARGKLSRGNMFPITPEGLDEATEHAVKVNDPFNVYVGVNPRKPGTPPGRANSDAIEISQFQFIDLDNVAAVSKLGQRSKITPATFAVFTGKKPAGIINVAIRSHDTRVSHLSQKNVGRSGSGQLGSVGSFRR